MNIKEREAELLDMLDAGKITWEQYADLYIDAQEDVGLYRKQRMWENIACVLMAFVFIFGGAAMYLTSKVCEDPNVVWDRCYRG